MFTRVVPRSYWSVDGLTPRFFPARRQANPEDPKVIAAWNAKGQPIPLTDNDRYGFYDALTRRFVIQPLYEEARPFTTWWAAAKLDGKWGFVDLDGYWIIQPRYQDVSLVSGGLAGVKIGEKWGFVSSAGQVVIDAIYDLASPCPNGIHRVKKGDTGSFVDDGGRTIGSDAAGFCLDDDTAAKWLQH